MGDTKACTNHRPITTLPVLSKIFEKLMYKRMSSFINKFELIVPFQYGFKPGSNTADPLFEFTNIIHSSLGIGEISCSVYLDFRKAFDCVDINILLMKLHHLGFRGTVHSWRKSFLTNRYQYVSCGGESSQRVLVTRGIPQGSTLGPLYILFLLYALMICTGVMTNSSIFIFWMIPPLRVMGQISMKWRIRLRRVLFVSKIG